MSRFCFFDNKIKFFDCETYENENDVVDLKN